MNKGNQKYKFLTTKVKRDIIRKSITLYEYSTKNTSNTPYSISDLLHYVREYTTPSIHNKRDKRDNSYFTQAEINHLISSFINNPSSITIEENTTDIINMFKNNTNEGEEDDNEINLQLNPNKRDIPNPFNQLNNMWKHKERRDYYIQNQMRIFREWIFSNKEEHKTIGTSKLHHWIVNMKYMCMYHMKYHKEGMKNGVVDPNFFICPYKSYESKSGL